MIAVGETAPDFEFTDLEGNRTRLSQWLQSGPAIVYFYPADFTAVCTRQACMMRDRSAELTQAGVRVVGISPQGEASHGRFSAKHALPFPLVPDTDRRIARAYGVEGPLGLFVRRASFLVGRDGKVRSAVRADLRLGRHADFLDEVLAQARGAR